MRRDGNRRGGSWDACALFCPEDNSQHWETMSSNLSKHNKIRVWATKRPELLRVYGSIEKFNSLDIGTSSEFFVLLEGNMSNTDEVQNHFPK